MNFSLFISYSFSMKWFKKMVIILTDHHQHLVASRNLLDVLLWHLDWISWKHEKPLLCYTSNCVLCITYTSWLKISFQSFKIILLIQNLSALEMIQHIYKLDDYSFVPELNPLVKYCWCSSASLCEHVNDRSVDAIIGNICNVLSITAETDLLCCQWWRYWPHAEKLKCEVETWDGKSAQGQIVNFLT